MARPCLRYAARDAAGDDRLQQAKSPPPVLAVEKEGVAGIASSGTVIERPACSKRNGRAIRRGLAYPSTWFMTPLVAQERESIVHALELTKGKIFGQDGAAELLGMKATTLAPGIKALGIKRR